MTAATLGFLGGTGPQGRGLALRLARAGHPVLLGSRDPARANAEAARLADLAPGAAIEGAGNLDVATRAYIVVVTVPYEAQRSTLDGLAGAIEGKVVVCCVNALAFDGGPHARRVEAGSAAEECRDLLPGARVVGAFHTVSASTLLDPDADLDEDVPVCGDDADARAEVVALADAIPGLRGVHAGPLRHAGTLEAMTAMLIAVNRHYGAHAGVRITGLPGA